MPVLINPQTNEAHEFQGPESQKLLSEGWLVPLINHQGQPEAVPYQQGQELLQGGGYSLLNDHQLDDLLNQTKYSSTAQKTAAFAEGVAKGLSGPAYSLVAPHTGLTTREDIKNREDYQPELSTAGDIAGTVGGAVTGTGLPGLIGKAGRAAGIVGKIAGKAGQLAASGAAEAALYTAADHINERILGDPEALSESLMGHVGLSALLGGGAGLAFTPLAGAISKAGRLTQKASEKLASSDHVIGKAADKIYETAADLMLPGIARPAARMAKKAVVNAALAIAPEKQTILNQLAHIGDLAQKTNSVLEKGAAGIFASQIEKAISPGREESTSTEEPKMNHLGTMVMDHAADPEKLIDKMSSNTMLMASAAPDISNALTANVAKAVNFLASKLPNPQKESLLDSDPKPLRQDIQQFNRYAQIIDNPMAVLEHIRNATLLPQDLEALTTVYPGLYNSMKSTVMDKLIHTMGKQKSNLLPYNKRLSLSLFLGTPLDSTLKGQSIMRNQEAFGTMQLQRQVQSQIQRISRSGMAKMDPLRDLTRSQRANMRR